LQEEAGKTKADFLAKKEEGSAVQEETDTTGATKKKAAKSKSKTKETQDTKAKAPKEAKEKEPKEVKPVEPKEATKETKEAKPSEAKKQTRTKRGATLMEVDNGEVEATKPAEEKVAFKVPAKPAKAPKITSDKPKSVETPSKPEASPAKPEEQPGVKTRRSSKLPTTPVVETEAAATKKVPAKKGKKAEPVPEIPKKENGTEAVEGRLAAFGFEDSANSTANLTPSKRNVSFGKNSIRGLCTVFLASNRFRYPRHTEGRSEQPSTQL
jgi:hypothetical protein